MKSNKIQISKVFSEAQKAEDALLFKRRIKVALTKAYKRAPAVLEDERRLGSIDAVINSISKIPTDVDLERLTVCYAIKRARTRFVV